MYIRMDRENILISMWDNKTMRYTSGVSYKNRLLKNYIPTEKKTTADVKEHVASLMPFLELDEEEPPIFNLTPVKKRGKDNGKR